MRTKRAFLVEPKKFEVREVDIAPEKDQLMVKITACGLCNWELNHWSGLIGEYPQSVGHEWAGEVVEMGSKCEGFQIGDKVTILPDSLTGFSEYACVGYKNAFKLNADADCRYTLGEPLKCITTVLRGTKAEFGDYGVIVGCGPMGLWCVQGLAGNFLGGLIAVDVDPAKLELAKKFGATHTINSKEQNAVEEINKITGGHMADFVIEGTGIPMVLNQCIPYLKNSGRGRLVLMSSHEKAADSFDFRDAIGKSIELIVAHPGYSVDQLDDLRRAVDMLNKGIFDLHEMISHTFKLDDIQTAFETLEHKPADYIKGIVVPS